jgi:membrane protein CcdC involved in cytochrome C biogenesis
VTQTAPTHMQWISTLVAVLMALLVIGIRMRASRKPTSLRKILIPPFAMSTGFLMFLFPEFRVPYTYALIALLVGILFSYPLIATSHMQVLDGSIYLKRSKMFPLILLGLLALRLLLHQFVERYVNVQQTGALFFILAFGMIVPWRIAMYRRFKKLQVETGV